LEIGRKIGEGSFGEVFYAKWRRSEVAVKRFYRQHANDDILLELRKEAVIMSSLRHPNIVLFMGACITPPNLCIVTEYMKNNSVNRFLRHCNAHNTQLSWRLRLRMAKQTAVGMDYLHSLRPPLIHRDLSSYNILVDKNLNVKIGDFGLSRIKANNTTMTRCNTAAWTAPEILKGTQYSEKSDVYSFAIVLWELYTQERPFQGMDPVTISQGVIGGLRPVIPETTPRTYRRLMRASWHDKANKRPNFEQIMAILEKLEENQEQIHRLQQQNQDICLSRDSHFKDQETEILDDELLLTATDEVDLHVDHSHDPEITTNLSLDFDDAVP